MDCKLTGAPAEVIRQAARRWSKVRGEKLGQFRTPRLLPSMEYETTANCAVHEGCHSGAGLVWRFRGRWETETTYKLHVSYADDHSGDVRAKTRSAKASSPTLSVQDHQHVIEAAEFLLMHGMKPTPSAVAVRLKAAGHDRVADKPMRSVLQWRHRNFGDATSEFLRSEEQFESFASQYMNPDVGPIAFSFLDVRAFSWVVLCVSFFDLLQEQHDAGLLEIFCLTSDFTFNLEWMGFSYGIIALIVMRKLAGLWRRSTWPLVVLCGKRENRDQYERGFAALKAELLRRNIRFPDQINLDYFAGSREAVSAIFPRVRQVPDMWHQRQNLIRNDRKGHAAKHLRQEGLSQSPKAKAKARAKPKAKAKAGAQARPKKQKQDAPHLSRRNIGAWLVLLTEFLFLPTRAFFHTILNAVLQRVQYVWQETRWLAYYQKQYVSQKPRQEQEDGSSFFWHGPWWSGPGSGLRGRPASQQPIESLNSAFKRLMRSFLSAMSGFGGGGGGRRQDFSQVDCSFPTYLVATCSYSGLGLYCSVFQIKSVSRRSAQAEHACRGCDFALRGLGDLGRAFACKRGAWPECGVPPSPARQPVHGLSHLPGRLDVVNWAGP